MSSEVYGRVWNLEVALRDLARQVGDLTVRVTALEQQKWSGGGSGFGSGGGGGFFVCMAPASGSIAGTWSGTAPTGGGSFTADVYQVTGTSTATLLGNFTIVNWLPATLSNSKACVLIPDQAGNYGVVSQSCT